MLSFRTYNIHHVNKDNNKEDDLPIYLHSASLVNYYEQMDELGLRHKQHDRVVGQRKNEPCATTSINKRRRNTRYGTPHISDLPVGFLVDLSAYLSQPSTRALFAVSMSAPHHHLHGSWAEG